MSTTSELSERLQNVLEHASHGVVGLVDDLLSLCPKKGLRLDWYADRCRIRCLTDNSEELLELPLRKSVFRAILARVGALCNERGPSSVSPYGGEGELLIGADQAALVKVTFVNTMDEQELELRPVPAGSAKIARS
ncbi:MAG: hypothetical protein HY000_26480 [Planctomycetes bacterium]|nr:hypothetical protein [Planctomycetota bacterium]